MDWTVAVLVVTSVLALVALTYKVLLSPYGDGRPKKREDESLFPRPPYGSFANGSEMDGVRRRGGTYGACLLCSQCLCVV